MIEFVVRGTPVPEGSTKSFYNRKADKVITMHQNKKPLDYYRFMIFETCLKRMQEMGFAMCDGPVTIDIVFYYDRPKSVPKTRQKITRPDLDKLVRAVLDGLTNVAYKDDSQVVSINAHKEYSVSGEDYTEIAISSPMWAKPSGTLSLLS